MGDRSSNCNSGGRKRSLHVNGPVLRGLRRAKGWTQQEAADKVGFSDRLIRKAESGGAIDLQSIALLAQLYSSAETRLTLNGLLDEPFTDAVTPYDPAQIESVVRRWYHEVWNDASFKAIDELVAADCILHVKGETLRGQAAVKQRMAAVHAAFSDFLLLIDQLVVFGNLAVVRWQASFVHKGVWMDQPPTGKRMEIYGTSWITVEMGVIREAWQVVDGPHLSR